MLHPRSKRRRATLYKMAPRRGIEPRPPGSKSGRHTCCVTGIGVREGFDGGRYGVRTHVPLSRNSVFKTDAISHSANLPKLARNTLGNWMPGQVSNLQPPDSESGVLPIELPGNNSYATGGGCGIRTRDRYRYLYSLSKRAPSATRPTLRTHAAVLAGTGCPGRFRTYNLLIQSQAIYR